MNAASTIVDGDLTVSGISNLQDLNVLGNLNVQGTSTFQSGATM